MRLRLICIIKLSNIIQVESIYRGVVQWTVSEFSIDHVAQLWLLNLQYAAQSSLILQPYQQNFFQRRNQVALAEVKWLLCLPTLKLQMTQLVCPLQTVEHIVNLHEHIVALEIQHMNPLNTDPGVPRLCFPSTATMPA